MSRTTSRATLRLLLLALAIADNSISASAAAGPPLPTWPQTFYVNPMEPHGFGLPVTAAGAITVAVHTQGAPIVVTLSRPDRTPARQVAGTGDLRLSYAATAAEVAASPLWHISIALQQPAPGAQASGSVQVQEPPIDAGKLAAFLAQPRQPRAAPDAAARAAMLAQFQAKTEATRRGFEQARAAHQAARFEAIRPRLEAAQARAAQAVSTRAIAPLTSTGPNVVRTPATQPITAAPNTTTTVLTAPNTVGARLTQPIAVPPPPPPPPVIALPLYTNQIEPGDTFQITGSGFGSQGPASAVHFVLGPQPADNYAARLTGYANPALGQITTWSDGEIFVTVPMVSGYSWLWAQIYVVRNDDGASSKPVEVYFTPLMEQWAFPATMITGSDQKVFPNSTIANYDNNWCSYLASTYPPTPPPLATVLPAQWTPWPRSSPIYGWAPWPYDPRVPQRGPYDLSWLPCDGAGGAFTGYKGDDIFTFQLKNGYSIGSIFFQDLSANLGCSGLGGGSGAYVSLANPPTAVAGNMQVDVRVWADACSSGDNHPYYWMVIYLQGPVGLSPFQ